MTKREWIIPPRYLMWIILFLIVYTIIAEAIDFYMLSFPMPNESSLKSRLEEWGLLWTILCSVMGWISKYTKQAIPKDGRILPIILPLISIGIWLSIYELWARYDSLNDPLFRSLYITGIIFPLVMSGVLCGAFWFQSFLWKQTARKDICPECGYDLRGTVSNRCSECGWQIGHSRTIRRAGWSRMYPELLLFETAEDRNKAWRDACGSQTKNPLFWILNIPWITSFILYFYIMSQEIYEDYRWWIVFGLFVVLSLLCPMVNIRMERRTLRHRLLDSGIPVCMKCGCDLREIIEPQRPECGSEIHT